MIRSHLAGGLMLLVLAATTGARADDATSVTEADRTAIRAVIEAQIAAFRTDDGVTAFRFASPSIQRQFGDPVTFLTMVRTGYLPVYRPREVQFRRPDRGSEPAGPAGPAGRAGARGGDRLLRHAEAGRRQLADRRLRPASGARARPLIGPLDGSARGSAGGWRPVTAE